MENGCDQNKPHEKNGQIRCYYINATAPHVVAQIGLLYPYLQPQTQAYTAWAARTPFAVSVDADERPQGLVEGVGLGQVVSDWQ